MNKNNISYDILHSSSISIWLAYLMNKRNHEKEKKRNSTILNEIVHDVISDIEERENSVLHKIHEEYFRESSHDDEEDEDNSTILEL